MNIVSCAVTTVKDSLTWCGHERYRIMMENEMKFFIIVLILEIDYKIIYENNKYSNMVYINVHNVIDEELTIILST